MRAAAFALALLAISLVAPVTPAAQANIGRDHSTLETAVGVDSVYRSRDGARLLVVLQGEEMRLHPELASGNLVFSGDDQDLWQLDAALPAASGVSPDEASPNRALEFFRGLHPMAQAQGHATTELSGQLTMGARTAEVSCGGAANVSGDSPADYVRVPSSEFEHRIAAGTLRLHPLPAVVQPLFLFEQRRTGDYVFVEGPVFNFRSDYRVWIGRLKHWSEVAVASDPLTWRSDRPGEIRFSAGGGLYVPLTIDLLPKADREHRGSPTLIRTSTAPVQSLDVPKLPRETLLSLGFGKPAFAELHTPCEPLAGVRAQVGPRSN